MHSPPDILLNTRTAAALIGRSIWALQRARHDRPDLDMPPPTYLPKRHVAYALADVLAWAARRGVPLHWEDFPTRLRLPAARLLGPHAPPALQAVLPLLAGPTSAANAPPATTPLPHWR